MPSGCERTLRFLPRSGLGEPLAAEVGEHAGRCLRCRLELARHHRLLRLLGQLAEERSELPPGLLADVLAAIEEAATRSVRRSLITGRRAACAAACLAAAAAGVVVRRLRGERPATAGV